MYVQCTLHYLIFTYLISYKIKILENRQKSVGEYLCAYILVKLSQDFWNDLLCLKFSEEMIFDTLSDQEQFSPNLVWKWKNE